MSLRSHRYSSAICDDREVHALSSRLAEDRGWCDLARSSDLCPMSWNQSRAGRRETRRSRPNSWRNPPPMSPIASLPSEVEDLRTEEVCADVGSKMARKPASA